MNLIINLIAFKIAWVATIFGSANNLPFIGPFMVLIAVTFHFWFAKDFFRELLLLSIAGMIGFFFDSVIVRLGLLVYSNGIFFPEAAPYWMVGLWVVFATTLNVSLKWMRSRYFLAALSGAIFGPISYVAGSKLGAVIINDANTVYIILAFGWAIVLPFLFFMARKLDGYNYDS